MSRIFISDLLLISVLVTCIPVSNASCGCKYTRNCYEAMIQNLQSSGEESCIENVAVGTATMEVFLHALQLYCGHIIKINNVKSTFEGKSLFEIVINGTTWGNSSRSVIILEAGQDGGESTVGFALYLIEQLVSCVENADLIQDVRWVIMPSTNPDGLEYNRNTLEKWKKNVRLIDNLSFGVDITRNFDDSWSTCPNKNPFSQSYPGEKPVSEEETKFIANVLEAYKADTKVYVSFRRDGHAILYPYASVNSSSDSAVKAKNFAAEIAAKVNQKMSLQWFNNDSIYNMNAEAHCGHSVDYAFNKLYIPYCFEMRMFLETNNEFISQLLTLPKGYEISLRTSYFNGIKEMYKLVTKNKNYVT